MTGLIQLIAGRCCGYETSGNNKYDGRDDTDVKRLFGHIVIFLSEVCFINGWLNCVPIGDGIYGLSSPQCCHASVCDGRDHEHRLHPNRP